MATDAVKIEAKPMIESVITVFALNNAPNVPASPPLNSNVDPAPPIDSKAGLDQLTKQQRQKQV